jgi:hypothetical protein
MSKKMSKQRFDEEAIGPLERGRGRYQQQDYDSALQFFNDVGIGYLNARRDCLRLTEWHRQVFPFQCTHSLQLNDTPHPLQSHY